MTLVELMLCVAIMGITTVAAGAAHTALRAQSAEVVLRERALQVLEAEARALVRGQADANAEARKRLLEELPQGRLERAVGGSGTVRLTVHWRGATAQRPSSRILVVWPAGASP